MFRVSLLEVNGQANSAEQDLLSAIVPLLKLITLSLIGVILAHPKTKLIPRATFKLLSKLVFALFLPCLIFTHLGQTINLKNFLLWWFIPMNTLLSTLIGCFLGYLVALICRPPPEFFRFTIIMTGFGNTGYLPMAIVASVCHNNDNPFGADCQTNGVAYVSFAQFISVLLVYTLVYHMMEPPREYYEIVEEGDEIEEETENANNMNNLSKPLLQEAEWQGMQDKGTEHSRTPVIANIFLNNVSNISMQSLSEIEAVEEGGRGISPRSVRCLAEPRMVKKMRIVAERTPVRHILQPPTIACLLAVVIGMVPQLKALFFGEDALLSFATDSLDIVAGAMVPSVMLVLGGMLAEGPSDSQLGKRTTIGIIVARLLLLPLIGIGVVVLADKMNLLVKGDQMFRFVLLLQYTTPSAILLGAIASFRGYAVREASALIFWQHVLAVVSISVYIVVYFRVVLSYV